MAKLKSVGVRELKNRLSEYLREVRLGTTVLVTDRGTVVAEIREPGSDTARSAQTTALDLWIEEGRLRGPQASKGPLPPTGVGLPDGTSVSILDRERGT